MLRGITKRQISRLTKVVGSSSEAVKDVESGQKLLFGGFGLVGIPENIIRALAAGKTRDHVVLSNEGGTDYFGLGLMIKNRQISRIISSYIGGNHELERQFLHGEIDVEFIPQGTLVEKCRAGGAGIPGFYTPTGVGTLVELGGEPVRLDKNGNIVLASEPKHTRIINGRKYLFEESIKGDWSFVKGWKGDKKGNVIFHKSARNFNPDIAVAGKRCIVEVEELLPTGTLDPDQVHLPSIYVHKIFQGERYDHPIENLILKNKGEKVVLQGGSEGRERIARRATKEIERGMYVNLGIGIPTLCANYLQPDYDVMFHSENGFLGLGEYPCKEELDADLINAGKFAVTIRPGGAFF